MITRMLVAVATSAALVWFQNTAVADEGLGADDKAGVRESFPIDPRDECLIVPFHIGGQSYRFILDTGFTTTLFDLPLRTYLGNPTGHRVFEMPVGETEADVYSAPPAKMGSLPLPMNETAICMDLSWMRQVSDCNFDGMLGNWMLRTWVIRLDFDHNRIDVLDPSVKDRSTWGEPIPFVYDETGWMRVLATVGTDRYVPLMVDTGYDGTISLARSTFAKTMESRDIRLTRTVKIATLAMDDSVQEGVLSSLAIGPFRHHNLRVNAIGDSALGFAYLKRFRVTIDFPKQTIYLAKGRHYNDREEPDDKSGLHLLRRDGEIVVDSIDPASSAEVAGIRPKDRLVRLEGKPATEFRLAEIRRFLKSAVGTVVHLTIQREKRTIEAQFQLKELSLLVPELNRESPSADGHR